VKIAAWLLKDALREVLIPPRGADYNRQASQELPARITPGRS